VVAANQPRRGVPLHPLKRSPQTDARRAHSKATARALARCPFIGINSPRPCPVQPNLEPAQVLTERSR
jgi:hypothetical protein